MSRHKENEMGAFKEVLIEIEDMKRWCLENYTRGGDMMVECWDDNEWFRFAGDHLYNTDSMWVMLKRITAVYADQQANERAIRAEWRGE
jgi:hypothetical protein